MAGPLAGLKVLDLAQAVSGPLATMMLGDYGADVIKVEPPGGDPSREWGPPFLGGESAYYLSVNRNKRSISIDLKAEEGRALVRRLAERCDILVSNFRPGVMERFGLGYESLAQANPGLIYASVSGYGPDGPYAQWPAYDQILQGVSGIMSVTGHGPGDHVRVGIALGDNLAALFLVQGVLAAVAARQQTGRGQRVETSLLQAMVCNLTFQAGRYFATGRAPQPQGNDHPLLVPYGLYQTGDGSMNIAVASESIWERLAHAVGRPDWLTDARFADNGARAAHREELRVQLEGALAARPTAEWVTSLNEAGVPCGPVLNIQQVFADPQVQHMGLAAQLSHPTAGEICVTGLPVTLSQTPASIRTAPPLLGEHTREVLGEAGFEAQEIDRLLANGVVHSHQVPNPKD